MGTDLTELSLADVVEMVTLGGAANAGLDHRTGSLTPGKDADLILVRTTDLNTAPGSDALGTLVGFANRGNVDTVLVGGWVKKWRGALVGVDVPAVLAAADASRDPPPAGAGLAPNPSAREGHHNTHKTKEHPIIELKNLEEDNPLIDQVRTASPGPVTVVNTYIVPEGKVDEFLAAWKRENELMKSSKGFISAQLYDSHTKGNVLTHLVVWESAADLAAAFMSDQLQALLAGYPEGSVSYPSLMKPIAVDGICVA